MRGTITSQRAFTISHLVAEAFARRRVAGLALIAKTEEIARAGLEMARRFHRGGKLIAFGNGQSSADAQHIAVEFVHPVIVGKRALPAISLTNDSATLTGLANREGWNGVFVHQLRYLARPQDIAVGLSQNGLHHNVLRGLEVAKALGLLTVALIGGKNGDAAPSVPVDYLLPADAEDPQAAREIQVTIYHILWELVHLFFEQGEELQLEAAR